MLRERNLPSEETPPLFSLLDEVWLCHILWRLRLDICVFACVSRECGRLATRIGFDYFPVVSRNVSYMSRYWFAGITFPKVSNYDTIDMHWFMTGYRTLCAREDLRPHCMTFARQLVPLLRANRIVQWYADQDIYFIVSEQASEVPVSIASHGLCNRAGLSRCRLPTHHILSLLHFTDASRTRVSRVERLVDRCTPMR